MSDQQPKSTFGRRAIQVIAELLIVFFGAYAAFTLSNSNDAKQETQNRIKFYQNFLDEVVILGQVTHDLKDKIDAYTKSFEDSLAENIMPPLQVHNDWTFTFNMYVTRAVFDDANFSNVGAGDYLVSIDMGTSLIRSIENELEIYRRNCQQLLYFSEYDHQNFYADGKLMPEYQWYIDDQKRISALLARLTIAIEKGAVPSTEELIRLEEE